MPAPGPDDPTPPGTPVPGPGVPAFGPAVPAFGPAAAAEALVRRHLDAVNRRDLAALLDGLAPDAVWVTGTTVVRGRAHLEPFFAAAFDGLLPRLRLRSLVAGPDLVACELTETATVDGADRHYPIAGFYAVHAGHLTRVTIYREGTAEV
ncbi:MAG TPA: nuclear transport factor 2 family protein [Pseudonocardiaceae bacterium]